MRTASISKQVCVGALVAAVLIPPLYCDATAIGQQVADRTSGQGPGAFDFRPKAPSTAPTSQSAKADFVASGRYFSAGRGESNGPRQGQPPVDTGSSALAANACAVLTDVNGTVIIRRGGKELAAVGTTLLIGGDTVEARKDSQALVIWSATPLPVGGGMTVEIAASKTLAGWLIGLRGALGQVLDDQGLPVNDRGFAMRGFAMRGSRPEEPLVCLSPRSGSLGDLPLALVPGGKPTFRWQASGKIAGARISILDSQGAAAIWTAPVVDGTTTMPYPAGRPALPAGTYIWQITGKLGGKKVDDARLFRVPTPAQWQPIEMELAALRRTSSETELGLVMGGAYLRHGLYDQAEASFRAAWKQAPGDRTLPLLIAVVYRRLDLNVPEDLKPGA